MEQSNQAIAGMAWEAMAESAYKAYAATTNNKNYQGMQMPAWADLPQAIRTAWEAATRQVGSCIDLRYAPDEQRWAGWTPPT